jgi:ankyrin repeat protein
LLNHGADPKLKDLDGRVAVFYTLYCENSFEAGDICRLLARHKCPLDELDNNKKSCLYEAVKLNKEGISIIN